VWYIEVAASSSSWVVERRRDWMGEFTAES